MLKLHLVFLTEQNRRGLRRGQPSRRMVALYDYDPRESSPNVDVEVQQTANNKQLNSSRWKPMPPHFTFIPPLFQDA